MPTMRPSNCATTTCSVPLVHLPPLLVSCKAASLPLALKVATAWSSRDLASSGVSARAAKVPRVSASAARVGVSHFIASTPIGGGRGGRQAARLGTRRRAQPTSAYPRHPTQLEWPDRAACPSARRRRRLKERVHSRRACRSLADAHTGLAGRPRRLPPKTAPTGTVPQPKPRPAAPRLWTAATTTRRGCRRPTHRPRMR